VLLLVVVWVWANAEAMAKPKMAMVAENNVFISYISLGSTWRELTNNNRCAALHRMWKHIA
jgi:hypothetical protein